jgi:hypothetical protein
MEKSMFREFNIWQSDIVPDPEMNDIISGIMPFLAGNFRPMALEALLNRNSGLLIDVGQAYPFDDMRLILLWIAAHWDRRSGTAALLLALVAELGALETLCERQIIRDRIIYWTRQSA